MFLDFKIGKNRMDLSFPRVLIMSCRAEYEKAVELIVGMNVSFAVSWPLLDDGVTRADVVPHIFIRCEDLNRVTEALSNWEGDPADPKWADEEGY